jgi:micrococcal nuclease
MRIAVVVLALAILGSAVPALADREIGPAYVTRVVSGDLIYAEIGGRLEAVRYIGVGVPLIEHPSRGSEPYAGVVREMNRRLVEGKWIRLVLEEPSRDRFGRLQAYVYVKGLFVNAALIHWGVAEAAPAALHPRYQAYFHSLEEGARNDHRGLWRYGDVLTYHRPRGPESDPDSAEYRERAADASGGRVFSAPAPFIPALTPGTSAPAASSATLAPPGGVSSGGSRGPVPQGGPTYMPRR